MTALGCSPQLVFCHFCPPPEQPYGVARRVFCSHSLPPLRALLSSRQRGLLSSLFVGFCPPLSSALQFLERESVVNFFVAPRPPPSFFSLPHPPCHALPFSIEIFSDFSLSSSPPHSSSPFPLCSFCISLRFERPCRYFSPCPERLAGPSPRPANSVFGSVP